MNTIELEAERERIGAALHTGPTYPRVSFRRSLGYILLIPAIAYVLTFVIATIPGIGLRHLGISKFGPVLDYGFTAHNVDADIVVFGDSSAFLGIDPRVVRTELGASTVVIPNTIGSLPATGEIPLQKYLASNKRPKLLVFYFSAWNMNYGYEKKTEFLFEGEEELLRYGSLKDVLVFSVHHPLEFLSFPFQAYRFLGIHNLAAAMQHPDRERETATARAFGHADYVLPYPVLRNPCQLRKQYVSGTSDQSVRDLLKRYGAQMRVAVYLAPVPGCAGAAEVAMHRFKNLNTLPPKVLPVSWFADDGFFAHVRPEHVVENSHMFSAAIRQTWMIASQ